MNSAESTAQKKESISFDHASLHWQSQFFIFLREDFFFSLRYSRIILKLLFAFLFGAFFFDALILELIGNDNAMRNAILSDSYWNRSD